MSRYGYKTGIILGLLLYAFGAFLFYPAAEAASFNLFLLALFILASGLTCLETAANPYVTVLGSPETAAHRLNVSQCFNGVGSFMGPIIASFLFFGDSQSNNPESLEAVKMVYVIIGIVVLVVAGIFVKTTLPEIKEDELLQEGSRVNKPLLQHSHFTFGVVTQFFYIAAQVGVAALFINYCTENGVGISNARAATLLSIALILFTAGRFVGTVAMRFIAAPKLLAAYALINVILCVLVVFNQAWISVYALLAVFFFMSIMFPTIFALSIKNLGHHTKKASSFLIMSIVGGALVPYFMGLLADHYATSIAYVIPMACFVVVFVYGIKGYKVKNENDIKNADKKILSDA
jgi:FHS family L-fucose permease-like MFS transporter